MNDLTYCSNKIQFEGNGFYVYLNDKWERIPEQDLQAEKSYFEDHGFTVEWIELKDCN